MPPRVGDLIRQLERAGFRNRGGKGSHRNFIHPNQPLIVTISGQPGDEAKAYQIRTVRQALQEVQR